MKLAYFFISLAAAAPSSYSPAPGAGLHRRDDFHSYINIGKNKILYGTIDPQEALRAIQEACPPQGPCNQTPISIPTSLGLDSANLEITVNGHYPNEEERNHFIDAIVAAVGVGTVTRTEEICNVPIGNQPPVCRDYTFHSQTEFIGIDRWNGQNNAGSMTATMALRVEDDRWCEIAIGLTQELIGAVSGIAGGFFGFIDSALQICGA